LLAPIISRLSRFPFLYKLFIVNRENNFFRYKLNFWKNQVFQYLIRCRSCRPVRKKMHKLTAISLHVAKTLTTWIFAQ
jgi:hypothetical protein